MNSHKILQPASSFPTSITSRHISDYNDNNSPSGILPSINKGKYASTSSWDLFGGSYDCVLDGCGYGEYIQQLSVKNAMRGHRSTTRFDDCRPPPQQQNGYPVYIQQQHGLDFPHCRVPMRGLGSTTCFDDTRGQHPPQQVCVENLHGFAPRLRPPPSS